MNTPKILPDNTPMERIPKKAKVGRNDPCPCKSGEKYKNCCLLNEQELAAKKREVEDRMELVKEKVNKLPPEQRQQAIKNLNNAARSKAAEMAALALPKPDVGEIIKNLDVTKDYEQG